MKADIHPKLFPVVFIDASTGDEIVTRSTARSRETREIDGVTHYVLRSDVTSFSHPFYTGRQRAVAAVGRVERFNQKYKKRRG
ncbi:MAG: type B 50S ribosomal protein L31 [Deltaproteobacteria bacterium]|nr:type B 50S ribosomal protein L31 [Deltaproteobacteria bacterium]